MSRVERWRLLLRAVREEARVETPPLDEARLELLRSVGLPAMIEELLLIGYPERSLPIGNLDFFPPRESLGTTGRWPRLFFVTEAWKSPRELHRRLELGEDGDEEMMRAAAELLHASRGEVPFGEEARRGGPLRFWRPIVERRLEDRVGEKEAERVLALLGNAHRADDYRLELETRLHWARIWFLLGIVAVIWAVTRDGRLSGRLLVAGVAFGVVGLGLGLAPWLRENARLRGLDDDDDEGGEDRPVEASDEDA